MVHSGGIPFSEGPDGVSLIGGWFVYTVVNKAISAGYIKTGAYIGENRKLDARFRAKCSQEFVETNAAAPTVKLQIICLALAVIWYRKWNFRAMGVSREFLRSGPLKRDTYAKPPDAVDPENAARKLLKTTLWIEYRL